MSLEIIKKDIKIDPYTGCWNWQKSLSSSGYGQKMINGIRHNSLHRYVYSLFNEISKNEVVRHKCHNRACCNPDHLIKGTSLDNYNDSIDVHRKSNEGRRKKWICQGKIYNSFRDFQQATGLSCHAIIKYTEENREFNVSLYRKNCIKGGYIPKV
jgi:hypothetical protein